MLAESLYDIHDKYDPPKHVAKELIRHAMRHIPNKQAVLSKLEKQGYNRLRGLKPHKYHSGGTLQFAFQN